MVAHRRFAAEMAAARDKPQATINSTLANNRQELALKDGSMLLFFLFPRYFLNSPVARQEKRFMRNQMLTRGKARVGLVCIVVCIGIFTASPLWHYMGPGTPHELFYLIALFYVDLAELTCGANNGSPPWRPCTIGFGGTLS